MLLEFPDAEPGVVERSMGATGLVIGVDEVGRGPLAGPVTVCAVLLSLDDVEWCQGVDDSKKLRAAARAALDLRIRERARAFELVHVEHDEIDVLNILGATMAGMRRAVQGVRRSAGVGDDVPVLIDGNRAPDGLEGRLRCIVGGDARSWAIGAASIIAKVARDHRMDAYDARWPVYDFAVNKGYPTPAHRAALAEHGPCEVHRRSFAPVAAAVR
jgi:ribonuclease HII